MRTTARGRRAAVLAAAATVLLATMSGCVAAPPNPSPTSSPTATPSPPPPTLDERARTIVEAMSERDRVASLLMFHVPGTDPAALRALVDAQHPGGLIFMGDNIGGGCDAVAALAASVQNAELPLLLAVDQEGGTVSRLPGDTMPAGSELHDSPVAATSEAFASRATIVHSCGLNTNFGVIADVTDDPSSFIFARSLGTTPDSAAERVAAAVTAEQGVGVLSTLKHFPGHGAAPGDSHTTIPRTGESLAEWRATDAVPFEAGIAAGARLVMFGHLLYSSVDELPASLSPRWHEILRDELGFDGIAISDDMAMLQASGDPEFADPVENAVRAIDAGSTMLLYTSPTAAGIEPAALIDALVAAVGDGRIPAATIDEAAVHVAAERLRLADG